MIQDLVIAFRSLMRRPGYASSVIVTLAFGIGASTMMFSLLDAALLRPLPFREPEQLIMLQGVYGRDRDVRGASLPEVLDWRSTNHTLSQVSVFDTTSLNMRWDSGVVRVPTEAVSAEYFDLLGVRAAKGRTFLPDEDQSFDTNAVAVISHRLWEERFGSRPDLQNTRVLFNDRVFSIVGVMPKGFAGVSFRADVWIPSMMLSLTSTSDAISNRANRWLFPLARLKDGVTIKQAQADLDRVANILSREYPENNTDRGIQIVNLKEVMLGNAGSLVGALFTAVLLFLLIACANVASVHLARTFSRRSELAVRVALGAARARIVRHLFAEVVVLAAFAGIAGAIIASWGSGIASVVLPQNALPAYVKAAVDIRSLGFAILISVLSAALVGVLPAVFGSRRDVSETTRAGVRTIQSGLGNIRHLSARQLIVAGELALAMTLLTSAGLIARSLMQQMRVSVGFDPQHVIAVRVKLPEARYAHEKRVAFVNQLSEKLAALPDVRSAAVGTDLPFRNVTNASRMALEQEPDSSIRYYRHRIGTGFLRTLGIPLLAGRDFDVQDGIGSPSVVIISAAGASRLFGDTSKAVGRTVLLGTQKTPAEVVGVVSNARFRGLTDNLTGTFSEPDVYVPFAQISDGDLDIAVRSISGNAVSLESLQKAVSDLDSTLPIYNVQKLEDAVAQQTAPTRFASGVLGIFSGGAILLAALGIYGLLSYIVTLSGHEIAIRLALGADSRLLFREIVRNAMTFILVGVFVGFGGAAVAALALRAQLFQTPALDPLTLFAVAAILLSVAAVAILIPARRAARINPSAALRPE
jgi:predicted permease